MATKLEHVNNAAKILKLVALVAVIAGGSFTVVTHFAKATTVDQLDHRLGLSISQDEIDRQESGVRWMKQQTAFERRGEPPTIAETEIIKEAECDLTEAKERHNHRVQDYEKQYPKSQRIK